MDAATKRDEREKIPGFTLAEKALGAIGVGTIGREVTRRTRAFGMRGLGHDPVALPAEFVASTGIEMTSLDALHAERDRVTLHTDLNRTSQHVVNAQALGLMRQGSYSINPSRGPVVDEAALELALRSGRLVRGPGQKACDRDASADRRRSRRRSGSWPTATGRAS